MNLFLKLAFLFFLGSTAGWVLELFFRHFTSKDGKWVNPGFCTGPYLPLYGFGLCLMYLLARLPIPIPGAGGEVVRLLAMTAGATALEYIAGIIGLKYFHVRLWDYRNCWGNIQGLICPLFTFFWGLLAAAYYFLLHPYILGALEWLARNLAFSFVIGLFFGVFLVDVCRSAQIIAKLKAFAEENQVVVRYEALKEQIRADSEKRRQKYHFFHPFRSQRNLAEYLKELRDSFEHIRKR